MNTNGEYAISVHGLCKKYRGFALDNVDIELPRGLVLGLVGENGAGKSTTIKSMLGVVNRDAGDVSLLGHDIDGADGKAARERIGVVLDEVGIPAPLTANDVGAVMASAYKNWDSAKYFSLLDRLSLPRKRPFSKLSRGMKMKLGIAAAMSHGAELLILDEATSGLDPVVRDEVVEMLRDFARDERCSVLISSHIVSDLEKLCDLIAFMHCGRILLQSDKDSLLDRYGILHTSAAGFASVPPESVLSIRESDYGVEAVVDKTIAGSRLGVGAASLEDIFIAMIKKGESK